MEYIRQIPVFYSNDCYDVLLTDCRVNENINLL